MLIHMPVNRRKKYWIQEKNPIAAYRPIEFPQKYRPMDIRFGSVEKQKSYAILNDRLETFDRYCSTVL
jgi:hypothetical protein